MLFCTEKKRETKSKASGDGDGMAADGPVQTAECVCDSQGAARSLLPY